MKKFISLIICLTISVKALAEPRFDLLDAGADQLDFFVSVSKKHDSPLEHIEEIVPKFKKHVSFIADCYKDVEPNLLQLTAEEFWKKSGKSFDAGQDTRLRLYHFLGSKSYNERRIAEGSMSIPQFYHFIWQSMLFLDQEKPFPQSHPMLVTNYEVIYASYYQDVYRNKFQTKGFDFKHYWLVPIFSDHGGAIGLRTIIRGFINKMYLSGVSTGGNIEAHGTFFANDRFKMIEHDLLHNASDLESFHNTDLYRNMLEKMATYADSLPTRKEQIVVYRDIFLLAHEDDYPLDSEGEIHSMKKMFEHNIRSLKHSLRVDVFTDQLFDEQSYTSFSVERFKEVFPEADVDILEYKKAVMFQSDFAQLLNIGRSPDNKIHFNSTSDWDIPAAVQVMDELIASWPAKYGHLFEE